MSQSTERFSSRVEDYIRYRPHYPLEVLKCLHSDCGLAEDSVIADIGSGTGILTEMFLRNGNAVYGVEPNQPMREAGERLLQGYPRFQSIAAPAEATTLPSASIDFVVAAQAFHWFDREKAKAEFKRILQPQGWVVLVWNERLETTTPFSEGYEQLLQTFATDYREVNHKRMDTEILRQFYGGDFQSRTFPNYQHFDFQGLKGRLLSSSYAPEAGHPHFEPMLIELQRIFNAHHDDKGQVTVEYDTNLYYGHLA